MTSKTSFLKGGIIRYQLKRFWWVSVVYGLLLFLTVPFLILSCDKESLLESIARFPNKAGAALRENEFMFILLIGMAVMLGVCVFRYMQEVRSATLFHSLPVTRTQLYISALVSGFVLLILPILANGLILFFMSLCGGYLQILPPIVILDWIGGQMLTGTATLFFCVFVGVLTGSSVVQFIFTFILCLLPVGIVTILSMLLHGWLFGFTFASIRSTQNFLLEIMPIFYPQFLTNENAIWWIPVLEGAYILLFAGLGLFLYQKRHTERAGDVVAFSWIRPVFLYGATFCVMLAGTSFVQEISDHSGQAPNVFVLLLFALLGYVAAKVLLTKSFRILPYYKGYVVFAVLVLLSFFAVDSNIMGFGKSVPAADKIQKVYVGDHLAANWQNEEFFSGTINAAVFQDSDSIALVRSLHRDAINSDRLATERDNAIMLEVYFSYELSSGRCVTRAYEVDIRHFLDLFSTDAAKDSMFPNFRLRPENIQFIVLADTGRELYGAEKEALIACVRKDLDVLRYEQITGSYIIDNDAALNEKESAENLTEKESLETEGLSDEWTTNCSLQIALEQPNGEISIAWMTINEYFKETMGWLHSHGYIPTGEVRKQP